MNTPKKLLSLALVCGMVLSGCSGTAADPTPTPEESPAAPLTAGTYTGTARGFHGDITVEVQVSESAILSVEVTENPETRFVADLATQQLPRDIVAQQSIAVDGYTGCTVSGNAVLRAVRSALSQAGDISAFQKEIGKPEVTDETITVDVAVIGGGTAGLSAALTAREQGASVLLVEKLDRVGGSTLISGGILYATGSPVNADMDNDVDALVDYWQMRAEGHADEAMLRIAAENSASTVAKMQEWGVLFAEKVGSAGTSPALRAHYASNAEAAGAATDGVDFIKPLYERALKEGVTILTGTAATELLTKDGAVVGLKAVSDEKNYTVNAGSVVIATGGFDLNQDMMAAHSPEMAGTWAVSSPGNTGDGIRMAEAVGAAVNYTGGVIGFKIIDVTKHYIEGSNLLGWLGLLGVTDQGVRFGNESADYPIFCTSLINARKAGAEKFYLLTDSSVEYYTGLAEEAVASGLGFKADSLDELAKAAGIDSVKLAETVETYNAHAAAGEADEYGKTGLVPVAAGPFYAVEIKPATLGTMGGLLLNDKAQVLDDAGQPIANLYAAGEVANSQFLYKEYPASGTSISISTSFGIIAGENAAVNAK